MANNADFKWRWNPPSLRTIKQPEILTPNEFLDMVERVDNERVDPLIGLRNQCMLLTTYFSCFRAVEVSQWKVKEALYPDGSLMFVTRLRKEGTKGNYPAIAHIPNVREYREYLEKWFDARVKHRIGLERKGASEYRGLDPESHVFLSNWRGMWQPFSLTRKVTKGKEYMVATAVQNLLTKLYKDYGYSNSSSHAGRHSFARFAQRLLEMKNNPDTSRIIQTLLHHRTEEAQRDYTDVDFTHIRKVAQTMMPKPKKRGRPKKEDL